jgi:hypothetical protein
VAELIYPPPRIRRTLLRHGCSHWQAVPLTTFSDLRELYHCFACGAEWSTSNARTAASDALRPVAGAS